ncbi:MAG: TldD/PmbA family protein [Bacteroidales bacterium]|nr:TldD/PmbA family protein [Bacteroidales bacterium]
MITKEEIQLARECIDFARMEGASAARITLTKSIENLVATLNGEVDKVTRCADRSMSIALFVDGRYGAFSINKLDRTTLKDFIHRAAATVRMLTPDEFRSLPDPARYCTSARTGLEMGLYDVNWETVEPADRTRMALNAAATGRVKDARLVSEEGEYSDSEYDVYLIDSQGLECRHSETSFDYGVEVTIEDESGNKYSDYWWTASPRLADFDPSDCGLTAVKRASGQFGAEPAPSGRYNMVIGAEVSSRLVTPMLNALNANSIQQGNSFLVGSEGKQLFAKGFSLLDEPWREGETGSKLFDSEGVCTVQAPIVKEGVVQHYFVNSYMAAKTGMAPTTDDASRPRLPGWPRDGLDRNSLMKMCGNGILVTDFNGGNCNMTTGDFSYGISGQLFENGKPVRPVHGMLMTGNFLKLWKSFLASGTDFRPCATKLIPSLAFSNVDFSG